MNDKQLEFLMNSLSFLEAELSHGDQALFLENCLNHMHRNGRLVRSEWLSLVPTGKERGQRTYLNWLTKFCDLLAEHKERLWQSYGGSLLKFPMLTKVSGGGAGNETYFEVKPQIISNEARIDSAFELKEGDSPSCRALGVQYRAKKLKRTPWYLALCNTAFGGRNSKITLLVALVILYWLSPLVVSYGLGYAWSRNDTEAMCIWGVLAVLYALLRQPIRNLISLAKDKVTLLDHLFTPVGSVCINEIIPGAEEVELHKAKRRLVSLDVVADCPICREAHGVTCSVVLGRRQFYSARLVGECLNNPKEHRYTFDKDTMRGNKIFE
ncbi:hypothetical protein KUV56_08555 [Ferrimonas balearica]|uniref:hypothetical protein n=1 Tax=Ferrimonas balearica TaxID=44012 RepID=UPI001C573B15|nr:hypothetical protein [Ferrimonas balearica]MBW3139564.1 hypothetical protein [Ferrimonas balearica]